MGENGEFQVRRLLSSGVLSSNVQSKFGPKKYQRMLETRSATHGQNDAQNQQTQEIRRHRGRSLHRVLLQSHRIGGLEGHAGGLQDVFRRRRLQVGIHAQVLARPHGGEEGDAARNDARGVEGAEEEGNAGEEATANAARQLLPVRRRRHGLRPRVRFRASSAGSRTARRAGSVHHARQLELEGRRLPHMPQPLRIALLRHV